MTSRAPRVAAAPISWGVCEVPDWGLQIAPDAVLEAMRAAGCTATELGPDDYLPADPSELGELFEALDMECAGAFVPVDIRTQSSLRHSRDVLDQVARRVVAAGGRHLNIAIVAPEWIAGQRLPGAHYELLGQHLDMLVELAGEHECVACLHQHVGTWVEHPDDLQRALESSSIGVCLDTGHLLLGGAEPVAFVAAWGDRVQHVHMKDVRRAVALAFDAAPFRELVHAGVFVPFGEGDADVIRVVQALTGSGYDGWFVLEQDRVIDSKATPQDALQAIHRDVVVSRERLLAAVDGSAASSAMQEQAQ